MNDITSIAEQSAIAQAANLAMFYDFETSGLPLFDQPSEDPRQPHIVQLGAALVNLDTRKTIQTIDVIVRPDGWIIPDEVSAIHGITTEMAMDLGVPESLAVEMLWSLWRGRLRIGHNEQFDARIMRIGLKRFMDQSGLELPPSDEWKAGRAECTARMSNKHVACPPTAAMKAAGRFHNKTPKLTEAYLHFTGTPLDGAHNAMVDVEGCKTVFFAVKDLEAA